MWLRITALNFQAKFVLRGNFSYKLLQRTKDDDMPFWGPQLPALERTHPGSSSRRGWCVPTALGASIWVRGKSGMWVGASVAHCCQGSPPTTRQPEPTAHRRPPGDQEHPGGGKYRERPSVHHGPRRPMSHLLSAPRPLGGQAHSGGARRLPCAHPACYDASSASSSMMGRGLYYCSCFTDEEVGAWG